MTYVSSYINVCVNLWLIRKAISKVYDHAFCDPKCDVRCSKAGRKDRCLQYCGICCRDCHCVPSGTYGNKDECPCYRDMKNSKGQPKCP
ncbi:peamaclein-like [Impatiens glandulifera]|uniref:peamaclein-like n=1 Tax=Impatiens glandulifera TaxID=253017 RepID=UPI001FB05FA9|nr:peamaclein-like [Impatiens glandulifera]